MKLSAAFVRLAAAAAIAATVLIPVAAYTTVFPAKGGRGDAATELRCPRGYYLVGLKGRAGDWLDQVALICRRIDPPDYAGGAQTTTRAVGGGGGAPVEAYCPRGSAIRGIGAFIRVEDAVQKAPYGIVFRCQRPRDGVLTGHFGIGNTDLLVDWDQIDPSKDYRYLKQNCPGHEYAAGLSVRHGQHVNAVGLICEDFSDPNTTAPPVVMQFEPRLKEPIGPGMEDDTNRVGADYRRFDLGQPDPAACQRACRDDSRTCRAWTYVRPRVQGPRAICYLKSEEPRPGPDPCCISGVEKRIIIMRPPILSTPAPTAPPASGGGAFEENTDRPGLDIARIELNTPDPQLCRRRCDDLDECRAWTYVRPGIQGPRAVCYLKSAAPPPKPSNCCVSGVK